MISFASYRTSIGTLNFGSRGAGTYLFGRGTQPTVDEATFLGGGIHLDGERAMRMLPAQKGSWATGEEFGAGILRGIDTEMERAIRMVSVARGHDPRKFPRAAFTITDPADYF